MKKLAKINFFSNYEFNLSLNLELGKTFSFLREYIVKYFSLENADQKSINDIFLIDKKPIIGNEKDSLEMNEKNLSLISLDFNKIINLRKTILDRRDFYDSLENLSKNINIIFFEELEELNDENFNKGGFSSIKTCKYQGKQCILKKYSESFDIKYFVEEVNFYSKFSHPNIPKFYGVVIQKSGSPMILTEIIQGDTLLNFVKNEVIDFKTKISIILEITKIIEFIHGFGVIHRDLKPNNILVKKVIENDQVSYKVFLIDFGSTMIVKDQIDITTVIGCAEYSAMEYHNNQIVGTFSDIWSLGCTIFYILYEKHLFKNTNELYEYKYHNKLNIGLIKDIDILILKCLDKDYKKRPKITYIENFMSYFYFQNFELKKEFNLQPKKIEIK